MELDEQEVLTLVGNAFTRLDLFEACYQQVIVEMASYTADVDYFMSMVFTSNFLFFGDDYEDEPQVGGGHPETLGPECPGPAG